MCAHTVRVVKVCHRPIRCHVYQSLFSLTASSHFIFRKTREFSLSFPTMWLISFVQSHKWPFLCLTVSRAIVCDVSDISVMCDDTRENPGLLKRFHNEQDVFTNLYWRDVNLSGKSLLILFDFEKHAIIILPRVQQIRYINIHKFVRCEMLQF